MSRHVMLVRVRITETSNTKKDLIDDAVADSDGVDHRVADGLGSIWQDSDDLRVLVVRLWVDADDLQAAEREARRIVAEALLAAGETDATTTIEDAHPDPR